MTCKRTYPTEVNTCTIKFKQQHMITYTNWIEDGENIFPLPENNLQQSQLKPVQHRHSDQHVFSYHRCNDIKQVAPGS